MTTLREAAQQALDELSYWRNKVLRDEADFVSDEYNETITTIRAALAEPVQEPVALNDGRLWQYPDGSIGIGSAPPQRKPLTEGEISNIWDGHVVPVFGKNGINPIVFARAIERAHGIT